MIEGTVYIPVKTLENFMRDVFTSLGVPEEDSRIAAEVLITSDLRGIELHGIGRLSMYYERLKKGTHLPVTNFGIVRESPATAVVNGNHGVGQVIGVRAMQLAIDKAKTYGMGSVAVRNSTHFGIDGYYPLMAVKAGMIGMSFTNARPSIAPTFGVQPMLGTNPVAFGAPTDEEFPFLFDAATSISQRGKIEVLSREEKPTPPGWAINQEGSAVMDSDQILRDLQTGKNALLPLGGIGEMLGGHKGYGLATMVEILSASLQGGSFLYGLTGFDKNHNPSHFKVGHFFLAINIESFTDLDEFKKTTGDILRQLRQSQKDPHHDRIFTAGEKEYENEKKVRKFGVPVVPNLQKDIKMIAADLGLTQYNFPF